MCIHVLQCCAMLGVSACTIPMFNCLELTYGFRTLAILCLGFLIVNLLTTTHGIVEFSWRSDLPSLMCRPDPVMSKGRRGWPTTSPPTAPCALKKPHNRRRFNWGKVYSKPAYANMLAMPGRRARAGISSHVSHFLERQHIQKETTKANNCPEGANVLAPGPQPLQLCGDLLKVQLGNLLAVVLTDGDSKFMDLPRQGRPLLLGEGSKCVRDYDHPIHPTFPHGNMSLLQPPAALSVQVSTATSPVPRIVAQYPLLHTEGGHDVCGAQDSFGSLQCFGSQLPVSYTKSPIDANLSSAGGHASVCPSRAFASLHSSCAHVVCRPCGARSDGGDMDGADPVCENFHQHFLGDLKSIRIPSMKLECVNQLLLGTSSDTWAVGFVLDNYTCLSSGRDLYDVEFGVSYGHQTVLVSDCKPLCDGEEHLHCSGAVLQPFLKGAFQGDVMTFPILGFACHGTPPLVDEHGFCGVYHTLAFLHATLLCVQSPIYIVWNGICLYDVHVSYMLLVKIGTNVAFHMYACSVSGFSWLRFSPSRKTHVDKCRS